MSLVRALYIPYTFTICRCILANDAATVPYNARTAGKVSFPGRFRLLLTHLNAIMAYKG